MTTTPTELTGIPATYVDEATGATYPVRNRGDLLVLTYFRDCSPRREPDGSWTFIGSTCRGPYGRQRRHFLRPRPDGDYEVGCHAGCRADVIRADRLARGFSDDMLEPPVANGSTAPEPPGVVTPLHVTVTPTTVRAGAMVGARITGAETMVITTSAPGWHHGAEVEGVGNDPADAMRGYCERLFGGDQSGEAFACLACGTGQHFERSGSYKIENFTNKFFAWPDGLDDLIRFALSKRDTVDVYIAPALRSSGTSRKKETTIPGRWLWADYDLEWTAERQAVIDRLPGTSVVVSGRGRHIYVPLATPAPDIEMLEHWNRRLASALGCDHKWSGDVVLRLPGTFNHKSAARGGEPTPVTMIPGERGDGLSFEYLAMVLPGDPEPAAASVKVERDQGVVDFGAEPLPDPPPAKIARLIAEPAGEDIDRSRRHFALIGACLDAGFTRGQCFTAAAQHAPSVAKWGATSLLAAEVDRSIKNLGDVRPDGAVDPSAFFDKAGLRAHTLADAIVEGGTIIVVGHDDLLYRYIDGVYRPDGDIYVQVRTRSLLGERFRPAHLSAMRAWFRAEYPTIYPYPPTQWVNCLNGLLDWQTGELHPHTPDVATTTQIPVAWHPDARCPRIEQYLTDVAPGSEHLLVELAGYALYPGNPFRKAALLLGDGRNGKSTYLRLVRALLGGANVAAVPLQTLTENTFAVADLFGKLANIAGDLDARAIKRSDLFKMLTGGDLIWAHHKYGHPFSFISIALPLFSANEAPLSSDQTSAWFDRWIVVPFDRRFSEEEADPHIDRALQTQAELEGLLVAALSAMRSLMERGRFELPDTVRAAGEQYRDELDSTRAFIDEECLIRPDLSVEQKTLYTVYRDWAHESGRLPVSTRNFSAHLRRNYSGKVELKKSHSRKWWIGIARNLAATTGGVPLTGDSGDSGDSSSSSLRVHTGGKGDSESPQSPQSPDAEIENLSEPAQHNAVGGETVGANHDVVDVAADIDLDRLRVKLRETARKNVSESARALPSEQAEALRSQFKADGYPTLRKPDGWSLRRLLEVDGLITNIGGRL